MSKLRRAFSQLRSTIQRPNPVKQALERLKEQFFEDLEPNDLLPEAEIKGIITESDAEIIRNKVPFI